MDRISFDAKTVETILSGDQTWYASKASYSGRGAIEVVQRCSDLAIGTCNVVACIGPLTKEVLQENAEKLSMQPHEFECLLNQCETNSIYALILKDPRRYAEPIPTEDPISLIA